MGISNLGLADTEDARKYLMDAYDISKRNHQLKMMKVLCLLILSYEFPKTVFSIFQLLIHFMASQIN